MTVQQRIAALVERDDFLQVPTVAHLCAGGETAILRSHSAAVEQFFALKSGGMTGREHGLMGMLQRCRERSAALGSGQGPTRTRNRPSVRPPSTVARAPSSSATRRAARLSEKAPAWIQ